MRNGMLGILMAALLSACASAPTLYHSLAIVPGHVNTVNTRIASLGVGPVQLPTLLDREGLVLRQNPNTLTVSDTHLWGGQLEDEFLNALTQQLQGRLPQVRVRRIPWELPQTPQWQVAVNVAQFDGALGGKAVLQGDWQLQQAADGKVVMSYPLHLERAVAGTRVEDVVRAQSLLVSDLADQVVADLAVR